MRAYLKIVPALTGHHTWPTFSGQTHRRAHTTTGLFSSGIEVLTEANLEAANVTGVL